MGRQNDHVGGEHFLHDFVGVIILDTLVQLLTDVAPAAITDVLFRQTNLLHLVSGFLRSTSELVAEQVGIAVLAAWSWREPIKPRRIRCKV